MGKTFLLCLLFFQIGFSQNKITEVDKLVATCKVWGFLKYYHPNVAAGQFDWDEQLYTILSKVEKTTTKEKFSTVIENWIKTLGKVPKIKIIDKLPKEKYFYKNLDFSWTDDTSVFSNKLSKMLDFIRENRFQGKQFYVSRNIDDDGYAAYEDKMDELGGVAHLQNERTSEHFTWKEKKYRCLTLFRYWNLIEYFAPNKYLIDKEWTSCLQDVLPKIISPKDELSYHYALLELVTNLNDSHASYYISAHNPYILIPDENYNYWLPFEVKIIDDYFVVTKILNEALAIKNDIQLGDAIVVLDNKTVSDFTEEYKKRIPASNLSYLLGKIAKEHLSFYNNEIEIEFFRSKNKLAKKVELYNRRNHFNDIRKVKNNEKYKILEENIGYLNIGNIYNKDLEIILPEIKDTKGTIIDIRNYPNLTQEKLAEFFKAKPTQYAKQIYADLYYPGRFIWEEPQFCGNENPNSYKGQIVILVNEETISQSETLVMCLQGVNDAIVIGSQTAGADGWNAGVKIIFNHFVTTFTGKGFFYPDGTEMQRIGIVPDIEIKPTIEGIRQGKDEVLDRAIEYINTGK
ncbi:peptidase S41 [Flavobacterium jejuense]|uniref:Peptidase S41 n=1 Tax=Flavobacterium jejuense TaxID=1544455 RepID=A0ABX0J111_9FLAO|nr:S41 family peptidase [Flavobacterium jejuense]NHN27669.1 peptidase S41 [Flavobacterium jejuense]